MNRLSKYILSIYSIGVGILLMFDGCKELGFIIAIAGILWFTNTWIKHSKNDK